MDDVEQLRVIIRFDNAILSEACAIWEQLRAEMATGSSTNEK
jgi:hypothetical protein